MPFLLLLACASAGPLPSTILYRDDGEVVTCPAEPREAHDACVRDHEAIGFRGLPAAYWGVVLAKEPPLRTVSVVRGSPAEVSGVVVGDIIRELDGTPVRRVTELFAVLQKKRPGDTLHATLARGGETVSVESVLAERPERNGSSAP